MKEVMFRGSKHYLLSGKEFFDLSTRDVEELFTRSWIHLVWTVRRPNGERWVLQERVPAHFAQPYMVAKGLTNAWVFIDL